MPLSWTEIKARAIAFSREWAAETRETAEAISFWDDPMMMPSPLAKAPAALDRAMIASRHKAQRHTPIGIKLAGSMARRVFQTKKNKE